LLHNLVVANDRKNIRLATVFVGILEVYSTKAKRVSVIKIVASSSKVLLFDILVRQSGGKAIKSGSIFALREARKSTIKRNLL